MLIAYTLGATSIIIRCLVQQDTTGTNPGDGFTGLTNTTTGLRIGTIADSEATTTAYTSAGSTIDTIATLATYAPPTAGHCRLKEVDATSHPGLIELQLDNARFAVTNAKSLEVCLSGVTGMAHCNFVVPLWTINPYEVNGGLQGLKGTVNPQSAALLTVNDTPTNWALQVINSADGTTQADVRDVNGTPINNNDIWTTALPGSYTSGQAGNILGNMIASVVTAIMTDLLSSTDFNTANSFGKLIKDNLDAKVSANVTVGGYATGQDPGTQILVTPSQKIATDASHRVTALDSSGAAFTTAGIATATMTDVSDTVGADVVAIKAQTDKFAFDLSNNVKSAPQTNVTIGGYATGQDPATLLFVNPANKIFTDSSNRVKSLDSSGATFTYTTPPTTAQIATAILTDVTVGDLGTVGSLGYNVNHAPGWYTSPGSFPTAAQVATAVFTDAMSSSDFNTPGSFGALIKTNIDTNINSRSTYAGTDTAGTTTLLTRIPGTIQPQTGDAYARLGAPAGLTIAADIATVQSTFPAGFNTLLISGGRVSVIAGVQKNKAIGKFQFLMTSDGKTPLPGLTVTAQRSIDNGALVNCANTVTELGGGRYSIDLDASDLNGGVIFVEFTATGAQLTAFTLITTP